MVERGGNYDKASAIRRHGEAEAVVAPRPVARVEPAPAPPAPAPVAPQIPYQMINGVSWGHIYAFAGMMPADKVREISRVELGLDHLTADQLLCSLLSYGVVNAYYELTKLFIYHGMPGITKAAEANPPVMPPAPVTHPAPRFLHQLTQLDVWYLREIFAGLMHSGDVQALAAQNGVLTTNNAQVLLRSLLEARKIPSYPALANLMAGISSRLADQVRRDKGIASAPVIAQPPVVVAPAPVAVQPAKAVEVRVSEENLSHLQIYTAITACEPLRKIICDNELKGRQETNPRLLLRALAFKITFQSQLISLLERHHLKGLLNIYLGPQPNGNSICDIYEDVELRNKNLFDKASPVDIQHIKQIALKNQVEVGNWRLLLRQLINEGIVSIGAGEEDSVFVLLEKCGLLRLYDQGGNASKPSQAGMWSEKMVDIPIGDKNFEHMEIYQAILMCWKIRQDICAKEHLGGEGVTSAIELFRAWQHQVATQSQLRTLLEKYNLRGLVNLYLNPVQVNTKKIAEIYAEMENKFGELFARLTGEDLKKLKQFGLKNADSPDSWIYILRQLVIEGTVKVGAEAEQSVYDLLNRCGLLHVLDSSPASRMLQR